MPKQYEAIRDKFVSKGMDYDKAQSRAAAIYNSKHPNNPVTGRSESVMNKGYQGRGAKYAKGGPVVQTSVSRFMKAPEPVRGTAGVGQQNYGKGKSPAKPSK